MSLKGQMRWKEGWTGMGWRHSFLAEVSLSLCRGGGESRKSSLGPGRYSSRVLCDSQVTLRDAGQGVKKAPKFS